MPNGEHLDFVLVVDDDADIVEAICFTLEGAGYTCEGARNGAEALKRLRAGRLPRVILLDMMMPEMNGSEFRAEQLRDPSLAALPIVLLTGDGAASRKASDLGVDRYLRKPVDLDHLLEAIRNAW